jgi:outer membrane lipoprotein-sorting protein
VEYDKIVAKLSQAKSFRVNISSRYSEGDADKQPSVVTSSLVFRAPNQYSLVLSAKLQTICDGNRTFLVKHHKKIYYRMGATETSTISYTSYKGFEPITGCQSKTTIDGIHAVVYNNQPVIQVHHRYNDPKVEGSYDVYYSIETGLPLAYVSSKKGSWTMAISYSDVVLDPPLSADAFTYHPSPGFEERVVFDGRRVTAKVGSQCPSFTLTTIDGKQINLTNILADNKALLMFFWRHG